LWLDAEAQRGLPGSQGDVDTVQSGDLFLIVSSANGGFNQIKITAHGIAFELHAAHSNEPGRLEEARRFRRQFRRNFRRRRAACRPAGMRRPRPNLASRE
jgi:hypothetical protein